MSIQENDAGQVPGGGGSGTATFRNLAPAPNAAAVAQPAPQKEPTADPAPRLPVVTIAVVSGSLSQAEVPMAVAPRYRGLPFAGAAKEFDYVLNSWLTRALELGMIGSGLGELFRVPLTRVKALGKVKTDELLLVGMGEPGYFAADDLRFLMTNVTVAVKSMHMESFSVPLIGARRGEMSLEIAARAFIEGVDDGYHRCQSMLDTMGNERERFLDSFVGDMKIVVVEGDDARATAIVAVFKRLSEDPSLLRSFQLRVSDKGAIATLAMTAAEASDVPPTEENHTYIRVVCPAQGSGTAAGSATDGSVVFQYSALTQTATIPVRELKSNPYFMHRLPGRLREAKTLSEQEDYGELWANYLVPDDFHRIIEGSGNLTLELDDTTACFPWEMVAFRKYGSAHFLGIDHQLTRMFRSTLSTVPGMPPPLNRMLRVLIIADPSPGDLRLPSARKEGLTVLKALEAAQIKWAGEYDIKATVRIGSFQEADQDDVRKALAEAAKATNVVWSEPKACEPLELLTLIVNHAYDVVHYAGHGDFNPATGRMGWVFDRDCVLSAEEIFRVRQVPRLVVANACFSAATAQSESDSDHDRLRQPVSLAQAFFARGIQNYLGTGWEVRDDSALTFADIFYLQVLGITRVNGGVENYDTAPPATLGDALASARRAILNQGTTWGAYQLYGQANTKLLPFRNLRSDEQ